MAPGERPSQRLQDIVLKGNSLSPHVIPCGLALTIDFGEFSGSALACCGDLPVLSSPCVFQMHVFANLLCHSLLFFWRTQKKPDICKQTHIVVLKPANCTYVVRYWVVPQVLKANSHFLQSNTRQAYSSWTVPWLGGNIFHNNKFRQNAHFTHKKQRAPLLRPWKSTKMMKMAHVTQANHRLPKTLFWQPR